jgi:hypothetical protein
MLEQLQNKLKHLKWLLWANRSMIVFGYLVSVTFNVLHADWNVFSIIIAMVSPTLLIYAFEIGSRIPIPKDPGWLRGVMIGVRIAATLLIAGITAWISYFHQRDSFLKWGGDPTQAAWLPIAIDLFMIVGSAGVMEVTAQMRDTETRIAGLTDAKQSKVTIAEGPIKEKSLSKRERIAILLRERPDATIEELAKLAEASPGYVSAIKAELKQKPAVPVNGNGSNGHTTVTVV